MKYATFNISKTSAIYIEFGIHLILSIRFILIQIFIRHIKFYIIKANTYFLLCFADINYLDIYFNNINNLLIINNICIPVICHFNHLFLLWKSSFNFFIT